MADTFDIRRYLTSDVVEEITKYVAGRLYMTYSGQVKRDEAMGWAGLGVSEAMANFDLERLSDKHDLGVAIPGWVRQKGYYMAMDEMRHAKVVDRKVKGVLKKTIVDAKSLAGMPGPEGEQCSFEPEDHRAIAPTSHPVARDFYLWAESVLTLDDADLLYYYYQCKLPMKQIGMVFSVSESRVSQHHTRILEKLKAMSGRQHS